MGKRQGKSQLFIAFLAVIFVFSWLGVLFIFFPISNPLHIVGGNSGAGFFFAALWGLGLMIATLLFFSIRSVLKDVLEKIGEELGVDLNYVLRDYKELIQDEILILLGKKLRSRDYEIDDDSL